MSTIVYVPKDSAARSVGSDEVAALLSLELIVRDTDITLIRTGSRGLLWLEPLVEVATERGRIGYGPVTSADIPSLLAADFLNGGEHPLCVGVVDDIPWLVDQQRITFCRVGIIDPLDLASYEAHGGLVGLRRSLEIGPRSIIDEVLASGLRGRGGAGFPAGIKWRTVMEAEADQKYVCCNADEGDSGTFADRMLMEGDPFSLVEGMTIAGISSGATKGLIYIRSEYPDAIATMREAVLLAREHGILGPDVLGSGKSFDIGVRVGAGSYVCGEETAMLESLEGLRGMVRAKPPIPALHGLFGSPTIVNNVLTLATVPMIMAQGAESYQSLGQGKSRGTQVFQLAGNIARGGIVERAFGISLRDLIEVYGGGTRSGRPIRSVQVGGPLGAYFAESALDVDMDYEELIGAGGMLGHGGIVVFDDSVDMADQARFAMEFCAKESCGKCTPCRVGSVRGVEVIDKILGNIDRDQNLELLTDLCDLMAEGSLCAMGGLTPMPVLSALRQFPEDFQR